MLRKIYAKWSFDLGKILIKDIKLNERIIEFAFSAKKPLCLIPDSDNSEFAIKEKAKIKSLFRNLVQIERETGRQETYLGFPFLAGHIIADVYVRGPIVLFPITIEHKRDLKPTGWYIVFSKDKKPILNRALVEAIKKVGKMGVPENFYDEFDDMVESILEEKNEKSDYYYSNNKPNEKNNINFESIFIDKLSKFFNSNNFLIKENNNYKDVFGHISELEPISLEQQRNMEKQDLQLVNLKVIGNFPQGDTAIYSDYLELLKKVKSGQGNIGIIDNLLEVPSYEDNVWDEGSNGNETDDDGKEFDLDNISTKKLNIVIDSDSSQENVILASDEQECTVVRGPPGTGKSQVIVNLIANALSNKKRVLVVCQKRAALDVVFQRLDKVGLSSYTALVHDYNSDRANLYTRLLNVLENPNRDDYSAIIYRSDYNSFKIDDLVKEQKKIVDSLHKEYFGGVSIHKLYTVSENNHSSILDLSDIISEVDYNLLSDLLFVVKTFENNCKKYDSPQEYPWKYRTDFSSFGYDEKSKINSIIEQLLSLISNKPMITCSSLDEQKSLIHSFEIVISESGIFKKFKSSWTDSRSNIQRILKLDNNNSIFSDKNKILELESMTKTGLESWNLINQLFNYLNKTKIESLQESFVSQELDVLVAQLHSMKEALVDFESIIEHDRKKKELNPTFRKVLDKCIDNLSANTAWDEILKKEIYYHWIKYIEKDNPSLLSSPFETYMQNRDRLSQLLKEQKRLNRLRLIFQIEDNIIRSTLKMNRKRRGFKDSWSYLQDELGKKRRVLPIRKLVQKYHDLLFKISPCWLASPESVSAIFPLERSFFDLIIFDEASQSSVERSLPSIYRGNNIVIFGDEKQLRPFDLFRIKDEDQEEEYEYNNNDDGNGELFDESLLSESLLVLAKRVYGYRYLTWHYRSKFQELIDFSNHAFYDGRLHVAPNVIRSNSLSTTPIRWVHCPNGLWTERKNIPEAALVVEELKKILSQNYSIINKDKQEEGSDKKLEKKLSIGIITFNDTQKEAILDEIDRKRQTDKIFEKLYLEAEDPQKNSLDDRPFIKNIENVQGDERDIIIFSVGYARDPDGKLHMRFGTLNQEGGENRLNVAITRARQQIIIVSSIDPEDLNIDNAKNDGPKRLKNYLKYAKYISEGNRENIDNILISVNNYFHNNIVQEKTPESDVFETKIEEKIKKSLTNIGYIVELNVGNSNYKIDLAIVHPQDSSKYILGIECDGKSFRSALSVRERDVIRQEFLESRGWKIERSWSKNWWQNPNKEIERIQKIIEQQIQQT